MLSLFVIVILSLLSLSAFAHASAIHNGYTGFCENQTVRGIHCIAKDITINVPPMVHVVLSSDSNLCFKYDRNKVKICGTSININTTNWLRITTYSRSFVKFNYSFTDLANRECNPPNAFEYILKRLSIMIDYKIKKFNMRFKQSDFFKIDQNAINTFFLIATPITIFIYIIFS